MRNQGEGPADAAWIEYKSLNPHLDLHRDRIIFMAGWNAALDWIQVRIAQFREIEEGLRKEIEELKKKNGD